MKNSRIDGESIRIELFRHGLEDEFMQAIKDIRPDDKGLYSCKDVAEWIDKKLNR